MKGKGILSGMVLMLAVLAIGSVGVAQATIITNTFTGIVNNGADYGFTNAGIDTGNLFGGGDLVSTPTPFTLTLNYDPANFNQGEDVSTFTLTIKGSSQTVAGPVWIFSNDGTDQQFQIVQDLQPTSYRELDLDLNFTSAPNYNLRLPTMSSPGDFTLASWNYFLYGDQLGFGLTVTAINPSAVPIPPSALLLGTGLLGLVGLGWRRRKLSQV